MRTVYGKGRVAAGDADVVATPRVPGAAKRGLLYVHGVEAEPGGGYQWMEKPTRWPLIRALVESGRTMVSADLGGNGTWGNTTHIAKITEARNYLLTQPDVLPGRIDILAQSMGATGALAWAAQNSSLVNRIILLIPVLNLTDLRNNSSFQGAIDAAYGGTYTEAAHGAAHNPLTIAQSGALSFTPMQVWYGDADTLCKPADTQAFADALGQFGAAGAQHEFRAMSGGHTEAIQLQVDPALVLPFING